MLYNDRYDYWYDIDPDAEPNPFSNAQDAVDCLVSELYDSANAINRQRITDALKFLCEKHNVDSEIVETEELVVVHQREESQKREKRFEQQMEKIRFNADILKKQLCTEEPFTEEMVEDSLKKICWEAGSPMYYGQKVQVQRKRTSGLFDYAVSLTRAQANF